MKLLKPILLGVIAGAIGAAIWAAIAVATEHEIGWIAWGIGLLVGFGVRIGAGSESEGPGYGALASILAVLAIVGGKYAAIHYSVESAVADNMLAGGLTDEDMIVGIADEVVLQFEEAGEPLNWPPGQDVEVADSQGDYPPNVWAEATRIYESLPAEDREAEKRGQQAAIEQNLPQLKAQFRDEAFRNSFSPIDILFFVLAIATAFKLGSGTGSGD